MFITCHFFRATRSQRVLPALPLASPLRPPIASLHVVLGRHLQGVGPSFTRRECFQNAGESPLPPSSACLPFITRLEARSTLSVAVAANSMNVSRVSLFAVSFGACADRNPFLAAVLDQFALIANPLTQQCWTILDDEPFVLFGSVDLCSVPLPGTSQI